MLELIDLEHPENWPIGLLSVLNYHYQLLRNWEERTKTRDASDYNQAICDIDAAMRPDGHFKFPHLWPVKFLQAGRANYQSFDGARAMRAVASLSR